MRRLLNQLFLINLAIFLVTVLAVFATNWVIAPESSPLGRAQLAVALVIDAEQPPAIIQARLFSMQREFDGHSSVYDRDGRLLASNTEPPLPLEPTFGTSRFATYDSADTQTGWIVFGPLPGKIIGETGRALLVALGIAGLLGLGLALLMTRWLVEPLTRLTEATRAIGRGEFGGRVALDRADEVGALGHAFDQMTRRLALLQRSQRELLASVSHELRTPLSRLRFVHAMLQEGESVDELLPELGADLDELERMVAGVLAAARLDLDLSGPAPLPLGPREPVQGRVLVDRVAARFRLAHPDRELVVDTHEPLGTIQVDVPALLRACDNLLDNAYRHGPPDRPLRLEARHVHERLVLAIVNEGPGIAPELHELLFTPFFRADPSRSRETGGLGLGLAIVARIVEAHGGTVDVHSREGAGATFTIRIPSERAD
jgi:signal transduction histidine kinase